MDVDAEEVARRRLSDTSRKREVASVEHLRKWQQAEAECLRGLCRQHGILFMSLQGQAATLQRLRTIITHFRRDTAVANMANVKARLDEVLPDRARLRAVLVTDADKTLAAEDRGALFWEALAEHRPWARTEPPLKELFGGPLGYSERAFRQATLLYEEVANDEEYERLCERIASVVKMYPGFVSLLRSLAEVDDIGAVVVTCGLRRVWEKILERERLSGKVKVVGGGRLADKVVVTPEVKAFVVTTLREVDGLTVWAFGDSPLDLSMLRLADEAIVVVGDERTRSRSMDTALSGCILRDGLQARQVLLPQSVTPRLDDNVLPHARFADQDFLNSICHHTSSRETLRGRGIVGTHVSHATDKNAAKLLMSPTRDASVAGPFLREEHQKIGRYLATEYLSQLLGVEEYPIQHMQGHLIPGYRLLGEESTSIVALMRGGEAMAFGVNEVFPRAMFIHANSALDVKLHHLQRQRVVILVDSVIDSGKTVVQFIQRVCHLKPDIRVVVVAGVVQAEAASPAHALSRLMARYGARLVALRIGEQIYRDQDN